MIADAPTDPYDPVNICCHELAHACVAWVRGYHLSEFCVREGAYINLKEVDLLQTEAGRIDIDPVDGVAIAAAGKFAEIEVLGAKDPPGCSVDDAIVERFTDRQQEGLHAARALIVEQRETIRLAATELQNRVWLPMQEGCREPSEIADLLAKHWQGVIPKAMDQQRTKGNS
jgi:hypothetical protein